MEKGDDDNNDDDDDNDDDEELEKEIISENMQFKYNLQK